MSKQSAKGNRQHSHPEVAAAAASGADAAAQSVDEDGADC